MTVFKEVKKFVADIVFIQESYVGGGVRAHPAYEIYWRMVREQ